MYQTQKLMLTLCIHEMKNKKQKNSLKDVLNSRFMYIMQQIKENMFQKKIIMLKLKTSLLVKDFS